jgi:hypothetical protein
MSGKAFLDSNVLAYAQDKLHPQHVILLETDGLTDGQTILGVKISNPLSNS